MENIVDVSNQPTWITLLHPHLGVLNTPKSRFLFLFICLFLFVARGINIVSSAALKPNYSNFTLSQFGVKSLLNWKSTEETEHNV
jgi:hypothetical protein